ncbi:tRNA nucleotidyltransferase/poly(A) polymerase family protein [Skeletonema marinoi]|uniref:tRNA nucleotidyltransferase/poly(A) polymerase family protein n=1 Tax=Skeletonema marinoi TaxID=267567 RepID=A0AAD8Y0M6_9STRA|nr:tRNA nucleotidyltransferase/poly(A) polymerase family protein [Skeletonema marinoi]
MNSEESLSTASAAAANNSIDEMNGDDDNCAQQTESTMDAASTSPSLPSSSAAQAEHDSNNPTEAAGMETESNENEDSANIQLHEHHHTSIPTASNDAQLTNNNNDESMIIQQCKSMEEASVTTTTILESVDMMDADDHERLDGVVATTTTAASSIESNGDSPMKLASSNEEEDVNMMSVSGPSSPQVVQPPSSTNQQQQQSSNNARSLSLHLTPEEERLFTLLINSAEAYERGELIIDPNPTEKSLSARGGFTKAATATAATTTASDSTSTDKDDTNKAQGTPSAPSWLKPPPQVNHIEIRIAGGWVRDKLLRQHSVDVDVALDCMMGVQFARIVQSYLAMEQEGGENSGKSGSSGGKKEEGVMNVDDEEDTNQQQQQQQADNETKPPSQRGHEKPKKKKKKTNKQPKIGVIGANPSQSKHLETATMNIHGIDVDFVNLRAEEVYEANSRIPTSKTRMFGTPLEDALRRDFTINSLFYNIRTGKVEDWTGRGLTDLMETRLIVTPVDPHETFHDDPLRVLRAIRFCVRLDFTLHNDIVQAAMSKRVHHSLHVKVSRERVGKELEGMLTGKHARPGCALDMIAELHLAGSVFAFPGSFPGDTGHVFGPVTGHILGVDYHGCCGKDGPEAVALAATHRARGWDESSALLALLPKVMESHVDEREMFLGEGNNGSPSVMDSRLLHICAFILPFHNLTFPDAKGRECSVTTHMIKEALKWSLKDVQAVSKILQHVDEMAEILSEIRSQSLQLQSQEEGGDVQLLLPFPCRLRSGLLLRSLKEHWVTCLLTASAWEMRSCHRLEENSSGDSTSTGAIDELPSRHFYRAIVGELDLDECWKVRPHLNGKEIIKELGLPKGPLVGMYIEDQTRWMLLNPKGSRDECMAHLAERKREREQEVAKEGEDDVIVDDQNEQNVGVANGDGKTSPDNTDGSKHFSKKFRSDVDQEAEMTLNNDR